MKKYWPVIIVVLVVALGAGWYFGSPYWTLRQVQTAVQSHDAAALNDKINFEALREDLKVDLVAAMQDEAKKRGGTEAAGAMLASAFAGQMIDQMVTPKGVEMMMDRAKSQGGGGAAAAMGAPDLNKFDTSKFDIQRSGLSEFRLINKESPEDGALIFRRDGLSWKLAGIDIPKGALGK